MIRGIGAAAVLAATLMSTAASAAFTTDIQQHSNFGDFFVPTDDQKFDAPWIRGRGEDWGWMHNGIAGTITSASLDISAYDVDFADGERDAVYAENNGVEVFLGFLQGTNIGWEFTTFNLDTDMFGDDINSGLKVFVKIGSVFNDVPGSQRDWKVSIAKSVLSVPAGGDLPPPTPGVPEPSSWAMLIAGFGLVGAMARRRRTAVAA